MRGGGRGADRGAAGGGPARRSRWVAPLALALTIAFALFLQARAPREGARGAGPPPSASGPAAAAGHELAATGPAHAPGYVGSAACAGCHAAEHTAWADSMHARGSRALGEAERTALAALPGVTLDDRGVRFAVPASVDPDGEGEILAAIGAAPLWQPLVSLSEGQVQPLDHAWDVERGEWFQVTDAPEGAWAHWTGRGQTWNSQCAPCHDTAVRVGWSAADAYATTRLEAGVGCEACHGPSARHAAAPERPTPEPRPGLDTCLGCHTRRSPLQAASTHGAALLDAYVPLSIGDVALYRPDGQLREETFEGASFLASRMHDAGVRCGDCHVGHTGALRRSGDELCLGCHGSRPGWGEHDRHDAPVACVDCHMPTTVFMQRQPRHDHLFPIPDPALAAELGTPDPCTACHADRDAAWAAERVAAWYGEALRPSAIRARAFARDDVDGLLEALAGDPNAAWRAAAAHRLAEHADEGRVARALLAAAADPEGLVRLEAVQALAATGRGRYVRDALRDPLRAVRVAAARASAPEWAASDPRAAELVAWLDANGDQPLAAVIRGRWLLGRGDASGAWPWLARAVRWDPGDAEVRLLFAFAALRLGRAPEARPPLQAATRLAPEVAGAWLALAALERESGNLVGALEVLERAAAVNGDPAIAAERARVVEALRARAAAGGPGR